VTYINRKGQTYYLHQGSTKSGKPKYFFARRDTGDLVETVPQGYEIYENPNARAVLRKMQPQIITDEELAIVEAGLQRYSQLERFIVDVKKNTIVIYTPDQDIDLLADTLDLLPGTRAKVIAVVDTLLTYSPMLQFVLIGKAHRLFQARQLTVLRIYPPQQQFAERLNKIDDLETLRLLVQRAVTVDNIAEFEQALATLTTPE
jgi:hypothetical protein